MVIEIDKSLLTKCELETYNSILAMKRELSDAAISFLAGAVVCAGLSAGAFWLVGTWMAEYPEVTTVLILPAAWILAFLGGAALLAGLVDYFQNKKREEAMAKFLQRIRYRTRAARAQAPQQSDSGSGSSDHGRFWATGTYDPERYYSETRGWSPEFRNYVRDAYGDLDTYEANKPD